MKYHKIEYANIEATKTKSPRYVDAVLMLGKINIARTQVVIEDRDYTFLVDLFSTKPSPEEIDEALSRYVAAANNPAVKTLNEAREKFVMRGLSLYEDCVFRFFNGDPLDELKPLHAEYVKEVADSGGESCPTCKLGSIQAKYRLLICKEVSK